MELVFNDKAYDRLEVDASYSHGFSASVVVHYRSRLQLLRAAQDERDLKAMACLNYHSIPPRSRRQHSVRIDDKHCLIIEVQQLRAQHVLQVFEIRASEQ
ncbi:MAG TPA: type II toxin-antitoxin system RelE/ParE family toxin [Steroidobacteraceae bacterium]|nr:type II toxin-antitoxin system RelE/ParE family toxin [Steroidobacteraceae bacterium]